MIGFNPGKQPLGDSEGYLGAGSYVRNPGEGGQGLSSDWDREDAEVAGHREHDRQWDVPTATSKGRRK